MCIGASKAQIRNRGDVKSRASGGSALSTGGGGPTLDAEVQRRPPVLPLLRERRLGAGHLRERGLDAPGECEEEVVELEDEAYDVARGCGAGRRGVVGEARDEKDAAAAARLRGPEEQVLESLAEALRGGEDVFAPPPPPPPARAKIFLVVPAQGLPPLWKFGHLGQLICTIPQYLEIHAYALPSFQSIYSLATLSTKYSIEVQNPNSILNHSSGISGSSTLGPQNILVVSNL
ncbi:hypothetical protein FB451DRAFT_1165938 [Mycena latifolia]|nr:hypothetical protein FB451DRAFT_1165938 [Mycena latifolia]